ncbi:Imm6 family immunity protein [Priestia aryabhattai]|uniref:Imm6 family immunity protein n=2 Tax=Priestia aryabhattai TaxID=412384 RepID=UPI0021AE01E6|nr:Imm6 family immunity protein [Priestia aryabhattai]MED4390541.1 Imm6 family immunity protein [Priestia aryabhattai]
MFKKMERLLNKHKEDFMKNKSILNLQSERKVGVVLIVAERVFSVISKGDERYPAGREALDKCWLWGESHTVTGDELYELIDSADYTGISEFAEEEEDLNMARLWSLLVDAVAYTSWEAYKNEKVKYVPQALEGIGADSITVFLNSAVETGFITVEEIERMELVFYDYECTSNETSIKREDFMKLF